MKPLLLSFCLFLAFKSVAQKGQDLTSEAFPYAADLQEIHREDSLLRFGQTIRAITRQVEEQQPTTYFAQGHYKLLGYHTAGWNEYYPGARQYFDQKFSAQSSSKIFTAQEILAKFNGAAKDSVALRTAPILVEQNPAHKLWTPISFDQHYFIFHRIRSYPHGNQTSWYQEMSYYFERVD